MTYLYHVVMTSKPTAKDEVLRKINAGFDNSRKLAEETHYSQEYLRRKVIPKLEEDGLITIIREPRGCTYHLKSSTAAASIETGILSTQNKRMDVRFEIEYGRYKDRSIFDRKMRFDGKILAVSAEKFHDAFQIPYIQNGTPQLFEISGIVKGAYVPQSMVTCRNCFFIEDPVIRHDIPPDEISGLSPCAISFKVKNPNEDVDFGEHVIT